MSVNIGERCRVCLQSEFLGSLYHENYHLSIMRFTDVKINENDGLPQNICYDCIKKLNACLEFKKLCEDTDRVLRPAPKIEIEILDSKDFVVKNFDSDGDDGYDMFETFFKSEDFHGNEDINDDSADSDYVPNEDIFLCDHCDYISDSEHDLTMHVLKMHNVKNIKCTFCALKFSDEESLTRHIQDRHDGKKGEIFKLAKECHICGKHFKVLAELVRHLYTHSGPGFTCKVCNKSFNSKGALKKHLFRHAKFKRYACPFCHKAFVHPTNLKSHMRIHNKNRKKYPCEVCGRLLKSEKTLQNHLKVHSQVRPYQCSHCKKAFTLEATLVAHEKLHEKKLEERKEVMDENGKIRRVEEEIPFQCEECGKICIGKKRLRVHKRVHIKDRAFKCSFCEKAFKLKYTLQVHERSHNTELPFICNYCGKRFKQLAYMKTHERIHTGSRQYMCTLCGKGYNKKRDIVNHYRTHPSNIIPDNIERQAE